MIRSNPNYVKMTEEFETSTLSSSGIRKQPTDKNMDNPARLLDLHRSFSHQTSHRTQPPSIRAAATTACVAARAAMSNSEEGSVVCCVPSFPDCHVES